MPVGLPSDEVAEDYKSSLEDLTINSRFEINNLTVIAKENTEHALAISRVLENHIKNTPPDRKLVALYVLDSIVKNVGTPYTLFLGRNLYQIFMNAYTLVNAQVRRKLDEMLRTWKEPVPGSLDPRPVFPPDTTRPIENALIKARTAAITQQQQQDFRSRQETLPRSRPMGTPNTAWRNTPTPPQTNGQYRPPPAQVFPPQGFPPQGFPPQNLPNGQYNQGRPPMPQPQYNQYHVPQAATPVYSQPQQHPQGYSQYPPPGISIDSLHADIERLVRSTQDEFATNPYDVSVQERLQALLTLQTILVQQQLLPVELQQVRDRVTKLSVATRRTLPTPAPIPTSYTPTAHQQPPPSHPVPNQSPPGQNLDFQALMSSNKLADIIAKAQRGVAPPPVSQAPAIPQIAPSSNSSAPGYSTGEPHSLLASLRAAGMLTPTNESLAPPRQIQSPYGTPQNAHTAHTGSARPGPVNDVELTSASLKIPRPHLISTLYEAQPNQCSTCGRRFLATEEGREKKARHLDWHFRTNQRLADSAKRGQSRSWYVDELEWITSRDSVDAPATTTPSTLHPSSPADIKKRYIPVPTDQTLANQPCPICQEKFDTIFSDEAQDFVWMDAVRIGVRVYHASCHSEVKKDGGSTPGRMGTPDSVLGKRKAAGEISSGRGKR